MRATFLGPFLITRHLTNAFFIVYLNLGEREQILLGGGGYKGEEGEGGCGGLGCGGCFTS